MSITTWDPSFSSGRAILLVAVLAFLALAFAARGWQKSPLSKLPYPPGPPPKSLISGNLSDLPIERPWLRYAGWSRKYGDIIQFRLYSQRIVLINSLDVAVELFEKRSNIYSDRPQAAMIYLMGWDFNIGLMPYGNKWRKQRRIYQQLYKPEAALAYRPTQVKKVNDMLYGLLTTPDDFRAHFRTVAAAIIMSLVYGHDISPTNDYYVCLAEAAVGKLADSLFPGANTVNAIPALRYLPAWFPGAGFKRFANEAKKLTDQMLNVPLKLVESKIAAGNSPSCLAAELLANSKSDEDYQNTKEISATSYAGGADTTASAIGTFFYAMAKFPEAQKKAQEEIDDVIGRDRIPGYDDRESLPQVEALYREVIRWMPVLPLGASRRVTDDDVYNGYYIPKGAVIIPNVWAMAHDPRKYRNPEAFDPSRFFDEKGELNDDEVTYPFGFGRRICPGRHLASATVWLTIATVLALFDIRKKKDASGRDTPIESDFTSGTVVHPIPYECNIVPRFDGAKDLILATKE